MKLTFKKDKWGNKQYPIENVWYYKGKFYIKDTDDAYEEDQLITDLENVVETYVVRSKEYSNDLYRTDSFATAKIFAEGYFQGLTNIDSDTIPRIVFEDKDKYRMISAAEAWCRLTNALIAKYKPLAEIKPNQTIKEVKKIEDFLVSHGYLSSKDLEKALH